MGVKAKGIIVSFPIPQSFSIRFDVPTAKNTKITSYNLKMEGAASSETYKTRVV